MGFLNRPVLRDSQAQKNGNETLFRYFPLLQGPKIIDKSPISHWNLSVYASPKSTVCFWKSFFVPLIRDTIKYHSNWYICYVQAYRNMCGPNMHVVHPIYQVLSLINNKVLICKLSSGLCERYTQNDTKKKSNIWLVLNLQKNQLSTSGHPEQALSGSEAGSRWPSLTLHVGLHTLHMPINTYNTVAMLLCCALNHSCTSLIQSSLLSFLSNTKSHWGCVKPLAVNCQEQCENPVETMWF